MLPKALKRVQDTLSLLPWIGEKTALRLAFFLFEANQQFSDEMSSAIANLHKDLTICPTCYGYTDSSRTVCTICDDINRDSSMLCVVEEYIDMLIIERSWSYKGYYHILGWSLSPIHGKPLAELTINRLFDRVQYQDEAKPIKEIILAVNPNLEWEATALYIEGRIPKKDTFKISRLSKWLPNAGYIEYADDLTLINAMRGRG